MGETSQIKPLVTVVIPCYNYADKVGRAIKSVQDQTLSNLECFIVDDGSTDDTHEAVEKAIEGDARFHYLYQENAGVANARNLGVFSGSAPFVCCLDADDAIDPNFLEVCVSAMEADISISIAYTGLFYIRPDGSSGLSTWPDKFNYDKFLEGTNQIPTCNVARRVVWERLGGQRQRYAPYGAGEEDAEMWLRAGAMGFDAKKVTDAGLFIYSWMSGRVSGDKNHRMVDYRMWHPWTKDGKHPFASIASPERQSHPVREYDEPIISVVIPVGPNHDKTIVDALDSLEAQTFRRWEAIVAWDADKPIPVYLKTAYPFVRWIVAEEKHGAGYARNIGASIARSSLLLFVDADDWLAPEAIGTLINVFSEERAITYSDYIGKSDIEPETARKYGDRLLDYNEKSKTAVVRYNSAEYDCRRALRQPEVDGKGYLYVWNLITSLVPKAWHDEIGGFDEKMPSWEDWDYWIRMAKSGKCFIRVDQPLVVYRFYTGSRREKGLQEPADLIQYLREKYQGVVDMPCSSCPGGRKTYVAAKGATVHPAANPASAGAFSMAKLYNDQDFLLISYDHLNRGSHRVVGPQTGIDYGYKGGGDRFLVHKDDIASNPNIFHVIEVAPIAPTKVEPPKDIVAPPPPKLVKEKKSAPVETPFDLQTIPGITPIIAQELNAFGVHSPEDIIAFGVERLKTEIKGIGPSRATAIVNYAKKKVAEQA